MVKVFGAMMVGILMMAIPSAVFAGVIIQSQSEPVVFGAGDLKKAIADAHLADAAVLVVTKQADDDKAIVEVLSKIPAKPESFVIAKSGSTIVIAGSDEVGAMYGCFELAERLRNEGVKAMMFDTPVIQSPCVEFRAVNPFLTLPYGQETVDTWWFLSEDFWQGYLDQLARARINWVDLHGMYDIKSTMFPNMYAYFIKSEQFPDAGVAPEMADRNLAMLKKVMHMAKSRGIKFAVMNYSTYDGNDCRKNSYKWTEDEMASYTRECVRKFVESCSDLAMFGFRIGESGKSEDFFRKSYIPGIQEAGRKVDLYTRSWFTTKEKVLEIANAFPGRLYVEIKYNGEQYGPPYIIAGGRMATIFHPDYSYREYFSYPRPYKVIYQVRLNGTHRVFPWGNPDFAALTARNSHLGGAVGISVEPINAYYPAYDYLHKDNSELRWYKWIYQRDWFFYEQWGRTSYDPNVPEKVWFAKFNDRFGKSGEQFYRAFVTASKIIPYAKTFNTQGPDHRNYAPELETGGSVVHWADDGPFDNQNIQSPKEYAESIVNNQPDARLTPLQAADMLDTLSEETLRYIKGAKEAGGGDSNEFNSLCVDMKMLSWLGRYNASRLRSATYFALYRLSHDTWAADASLKYHQEAVNNWQQLSIFGEENFKPFVERLRMHTENYTWANEAKRSTFNAVSLVNEISPIDKLQPLKPLQLKADILMPKGDKTGPVVKIAAVRLSDGYPGEKVLEVRADVNDPAGVKVVLFKYKILPSRAIWNTLPMKRNGNFWDASVPVQPEGLMWCIETLDKDDNGTMWPDFRTDIPYKVIESWDVNNSTKGKE